MSLHSYIVVLFITHASAISSELVLSVLLETFEFGLGPEIDWTMVGIARPIAKNASNKTALPLKVNPVKIQSEV